MSAIISSANEAELAERARTDPFQYARAAGRLASVADPPAMLYHMDVELIYLGGPNLLSQQAGCLIYGYLGVNQSQPFCYSKNMGIHR